MKEIIYEYGAGLIAAVAAIIFFAIIGKMIWHEEGIISSFIVLITNNSV